MMTSRTFSFPRMLAMAGKEWIQIRRDGRSLALAFALPAILLYLFGVAINTDVTNIRMAVLDRDHTARSRALVDAFGQSGYFDVRTTLTRADQAEAAIDRNDVRMVLVIPERFAADLDAGRPAPVEVILDGSDAKTATVARGYADAIARTFSGKVLLHDQAVGTPLVAETRVWFNETLDSKAMVTPGLIAVIMSIISAMLTSLTIAREWERGTMEQLASTPVGRAEVIFGKLLPYLGIALIDVAIALLCCIYLFEVPFRGSFLLYGLSSVVFLAGVLGLGILLSSALKSQLLAVQASIFATYMPALLLSGFFYSLSSMPRFLELVSRLVPARYFVSITRGLFLRGIGLEIIWPPLAGLAVFAFAMVALSIRNFRKELA
ncbi:MAG TPA: ABC transporter permease [Gemmatimonadales bacterium]|nr:ABC transporter permease [Gemmatimonadales bacterium]